MRKIILPLLLLGICFVVKAQTEEHPQTFLDRISVGIKGGIHNSRMKYSNLNNYSPTFVTSGVGGIFAEIKLNKKGSFSIRPELLFLSRGTKISESNIDYTIHAKYTDFRIPVIYSFTQPKIIIPYLFIAPTISFIRGGNIQLNEYKVDVSRANFASVNFSLTGGAGFKVPIRITPAISLLAGLEANYQIGLTNTYSSEELDGKSLAINQAIYETTGTRKLQGWEITASVAIPLSIFRKKVKTVVPPTEQPVIPVIVPEEKPCYTLEEIIGMITAGEAISGKKICAVDVINFEFGKSTLDKNSCNYLDKIVTLMKKGSIKMQINGHTDNIGTDDFNMKLSQKRAKAVYDYLINKGAETSRLSYLYFGMRKPIAPNDTEEGRLINRRVEFEISEQ